MVTVAENNPEKLFSFSKEIQYSFAESRIFNHFRQRNPIFFCRISIFRSLRLELKDGIYCPFHSCVGCANVIDENMKNLMEKYINDETQVEFLPVKAHSEEYGEKQYFILHFLKVHDVIDTEHTVYAPFRRPSRHS